MHYNVMVKLNYYGVASHVKNTMQLVGWLVQA